MLLLRVSDYASKEIRVKKGRHTLLLHVAYYSSKGYTHC
jgi:hypothetical protein